MPVKFAQIIDQASSLKEFLGFFAHAAAQKNLTFLDAHRVILTACYNNSELSPSLNGRTPEALAQAWLSKYFTSYENRISQRISNPPGTVPDPIVSTIIRARLPKLTVKNLEQIKYAHRLSMSAENILGLLLEEFLAEQLLDYGWHCCWGHLIKHVDFCNSDGSLLQIKNRSNSENSSSATVRINQPIEKWFRVDAVTGVYQWSFFNQKYQTDRFSEENFVAFVEGILAQNPGALAVEPQNPW
jgi:hypothetical protein